jgi:hypothetical protein
MTKEDLKKLKDMAESILKMVSAMTPDEDTEIRIDRHSTEHVLRKYLEHRRMDSDAMIVDGYCGDVISKFYPYQECTNPFSCYLSRDYADYAAVGKKFLDACLAFKWCYDAEYNPNWGNRQEIKWYVIWDYNLSRFTVFHAQSFPSPSTVYYSSREIAQKCADWLDVSWKQGGIL